ncbi:MAG TPA: hypothetical protein VNU48_08730 [Burkholderiaceae bacterium]|nr:hypothetical protein [Burkholderiaceae bacterium]
MRNSAWMLAVVLTFPSVPALAADGDGAMPGSGQLPWARWQGRLSLGTTSSPWRPGADTAAPTLSSASLMGDYYFSRWLTGPQGLGGFRATSGLIFGQRSMLSTGQPGFATGGAFSIGSRSTARAPAPYPGDAAGDSTTLPYVGLGYTGLSPRSGWSFSADLGLVAQGAGGAARLGRSLYGSQSLDDAVRDLRMTPLVQLGVTYAF